jgi:hypothetical protein
VFDVKREYSSELVMGIIRLLQAVLFAFLLQQGDTLLNFSSGSGPTELVGFCFSLKRELQGWDQQSHRCGRSKSS